MTRRSIGLVCFLAVAAAGPAAAQNTAPAGNLAFVSASVTPNTAGGRGGLGTRPDGRVTWTNVTLRELIATAYQRNGLDDPEVRGGPAWVDSARFDVVADPGDRPLFDPDGFPSRLYLMLRTLLAQRFGVKVHTESREVPAYALVMVKAGQLGPQLRKSTIDCAAVMEQIRKGQRSTNCGFGAYPRRLVASGISMPRLGWFLSGLVKRPVIDRTGLPGNFDLEVEAVEIVQPGPGGPSTRPSDTSRSIFVTMPEQLGLRLDAIQASIDDIVIDDATQPAP